MAKLARALLIARPRTPFVAWVIAQSGMSDVETQVEIAHERTAYLIPPFTYEIDLDSILGEVCEDVFRCELGRWCDDKTSWPDERDLNTFKAWFDVEIHREVVDLDEGPLAHSL